MKVCIRCNPVSELVDTPDGLRCPVHEDRYVLEVQEAPAAPVVEVASEVDPQ